MCEGIFNIVLGRGSSPRTVVVSDLAFNKIRFFRASDYDGKNL